MRNHVKERKPKMEVSVVPSSCSEFLIGLFLSYLMAVLMVASLVIQLAGGKAEH